MKVLRQAACTLAFLGSLGPAGCEGPAGPPGPKGDPGIDTTMEVVSVEPSRVLLGHRASIEIAATHTSFVQGKTQVSFDDPNIKVESVAVLGPQLLRVDILAGPEDPAQRDTYAAVRSHDVTISTSGDRPETVGIKMFAVEPGLEAAVLNGAGRPGGTLRQGGIARVSLASRDPQAPLVYGSQVTSLDDGVSLQASAITPAGMQVLAAVDVNASWSPGILAQNAAQLLLPGGIQGQSLEIAPRPPADLAMGQARAVQLGDGTDSQLFKLALPAGEQVLSLALGRTSPGPGAPVAALLPESGKWKERLQLRGGTQAAQGTAAPQLAVVPRGGDVHVVVYDARLAGAASSEATMTIKAQAAYGPDMIFASDDPGRPNKQIDLSKGPNHFKTIAMPAPGQKSFFGLITSTAGPHYVLTGTSAGSPGTPQLEILDGPCSGGKPLARGVSDGSGYQTASFDADAEKVYCVVVTSSYYTPGPNYSLLVTSAL